MVTTTQRLSVAGFNRGYMVFHGEEIAAARRLHDAATLVHGKARVRRMLRESPASVFRALRYGRRWISDEDGGAVCLVFDNERFTSGKGSDGSILVPGRRGWREFVGRTRQLCRQSRWAEGFTASAEALDGMGYAVAESLTALMAFGIESDEDVLFSETAATQRGR